MKFDRAKIKTGMILRYRHHSPGNWLYVLVLTVPAHEDDVFDTVRYDKGFIRRDGFHFVSAEDWEIV